METGLLWFDDDPQRELEEKIKRAARHYQQKFGQPPNICYVHPSLLDGASRQVDKLEVAPLSSVLRHHFWVGKEREKHPSKS